MASINDIETIVVVMMENRSFDNVLGHLSHPKYGGRSDIDGLKDSATTPEYDNFYDHQVYKHFPTTDREFRHDLPHQRAEIATQLDIVNGQSTMAGFVKAYVQSTQSVVKKPPPMGFLRPKAVPMSGFFAKEYLVCDRWFSPLPSGTQPNRAMAFSGSTLIDDNVTGPIPYQDFVFDWLDEHNVRWRVYHTGLSFFLLFGRFNDVLGPNFRSIRRLAQDFQKESTGEGPQVIFIEPEYDDSPVHFGYTPNDNHPPLPIAPGEAFLHGIYLALTTNPARWAKTLLVITHDEHGGFFDHVSPKPIRTDPPTDADYAPFEVTGIRVPALVASPLVARGGVCKATLDHTSFLQLLAERFAGGTGAYSNEVTTRRDQGIASLSQVLSTTVPREDVPKPPVAPIIVRSIVQPVVKEALNENQIAFADAARECLEADRDNALERFPELAMLTRIS